MNAIGYLLIGLSAGWIIEWLLDFYYWQKKIQEARSARTTAEKKLGATENALLLIRQDLSEAESEIRDYKARLTQAEQEAASLKNQLEEKEKALAAHLAEARGEEAAAEPSISQARPASLVEIPEDHLVTPEPDPAVQAPVSFLKRTYRTVSAGCAWGFSQIGSAGRLTLKGAEKLWSYTRTGGRKLWGWVRRNSFKESAS